MKNLFKNFIRYKKLIAFLVLVLMVQAYCDLALPRYTQDIIDTGIQNHGIEHVLPEKITSARYDQVRTYMTDEEKLVFESSYSEDEDVYSLRVNDRKKLDDLDDMFLIPMVLAFEMEERGDESAGMASGNIQEARKVLTETSEQIGTGTMTAEAAQYAYILDKEAGIDVDSVQTAYLWTAGAKMLLMALIMFLASAVVAYFASRIGADVGRDLRSRIFGRVMQYSNAEMDQFSTASLITRCTNDVQQVQLVITMILRMLLYAPVMCLWGIVNVAATGSGMEWIIVLAILAVVGLVSLMISLTMPTFKRMQQLMDALNRVSREILTGLSVIRAFGSEKMEEKRFDKANTDLTKANLFTSRIMTMMQPAMMLIMNGLVVVITWVAAHRIDDGVMQVGQMTAFITYSMMIVISFLMMSIMSIMLPRAGVAADRIEEILTTESSVVEAEDTEDMKKRGGEVRFSHVDFRYPGAEENALYDIDFTAEAGKTTAIIGSTGCGKSTLVHLIPRFYDVTSGSISVNGTDVRKLRIDDLRGAIGFIPQKGVLFSGSIADNIRFGDEAASEEEVERAADIAQAMEFINDKEEGMESHVSQGGSNVSGGQKQRLAIARAIAKKPDLLVFDDSFSALDMKTDAALRQRLSEELEGVTKIIVAQRISTILRADQILVLDEGRICGKGTHRELMDTCEVYREIAESQLSKAELSGIA